MRETVSWRGAERRKEPRVAFTGSVDVYISSDELKCMTLSEIRTRLCLSKVTDFDHDNALTTWILDSAAESELETIEWTCLVGADQ